MGSEPCSPVPACRPSTSTADSPDAMSLLTESGLDYEGAPLVRTADGRMLVDPDDAELARAYGLETALPDRTVDVAVVGAGPGGLAAAVYAASEGLDTLVLEGESIGGQAGSSSLIRNYLGFSRGVSGSELAQRAYQQAWVFGARFAHTRRVTGMRLADGRVRARGGGRRDRAGAGGRARDGRQLPAAGGPRAAALRRGIRLLRRLIRRGPGAGGTRRARGGRRQLGRAGRASTSPGTPARSRSWCAGPRSRRACRAT